MEVLAERAGGFVLLSLEQVGPGEPDRRVVAFDRDLRERWTAPSRGMEPWHPAPPGPGGILFRSGIAEVRWFDEETGADRIGDLPYPEGVPPGDLLGTTLGRHPDNWVVVAYARGQPR